MDNFLEIEVPFRSLALALREDFAEVVAEEAWRIYCQASEGSPEFKKALRAAIRDHIIVPGFRRGQAHRAPAALLRPIVVEVWRNCEDMAWAVLGLWSEGKKELLQQVRAFLQEAGLPTEGLAAPNLSGYWKWREFQNYVDRFREAFPGAGSEDEVRLAIALLTGRLPMPDEAYEELVKTLSGGEEMTRGFWTRVLEEMRRLPPEAPEWDTLDDFIRAAREIGEEKLRERTINLHRSALREAVEAFRTSRSQWIEFFQMDQCANWSVEACPSRQVEEAASLLQELEELIGQYEALDSLRPSTVAERRDRERQLRELEEQIQTLYASINERLIAREEERAPFEEVEEAEEIQIFEETAEIQGLEEAISPEKTIPVEEVPAPEETFVPEGAPEETSLVLEEMALSQEEVTLPSAEEALEGWAPIPEEPVPPLEPEAPSLIGEEMVLGKEVSPAAVEMVEMRAEELSPVSSAAEELEREANRLLVSLVSEGDLLTGYWLAWAMEQQNLRPHIPAPVIQAVQGAFWAMRTWPEVPSKILHDLRTIPQQRPSLERKAEQWAGVAAALYLALVAPLDGWGDWLNIGDDDIPALKELAASVRSFATLGWTLQPEDIKSAWREEEREQVIRSLAERAYQWLEMAPHRRTNFQRASAVWRSLTRPQGDLYRWFVLVAQDQRGAVDQVRQALENWEDEKWIDERVQEIDLELVGRRLNPIEGIARKQIIRWAREACDVAERWVQLVLQERHFAQRGEWLQEQIRTLLKQFQSLPVIELHIEGILASLCEQEAEYAALSLLRRSVLGLKKLFAFPDGALPVSIKDVPEFALRERSLYENLVVGLFWFPEALVLDMDNSGRIVLREKNAGNLLNLLLNSSSQNPPAEEVVGRWIRLSDYRFVGDFLTLASFPDDSQREILEARYREALRSDLRLLNEEVAKTIATVEQALIDGLISEAERNRYIGAVEAVRREISKISQQPEEERHRLNIQGLRKRLLDVQDELKDKRRSRLEGQRKRWSRLQDAIVSTLSPEQFHQVRQAVDRAMEREAIRIVDEYLVGLENALQGKPELLGSLLATPAKKDRLREFRESIQILAENLEVYGLQEMARKIVGGAAPGDLGLPRLPAPRRQEIARAFIAWHYLKKSEGLEGASAEFHHVAELVKYLGFRIKDTSAISLIHREPGLRHWRVAAMPERPELVPVPQFGSERKGEYDVIGIWDRPGFNLMSALVERTADRPSIIFYFGRLLKRQREDLLNSDALRFMRVPILILDEILLVFLAREYDVRMEAFFACTLPYTNLNPYVPFAAGSVPPEMFVGRKAEIAELLDPLGPAIVYGGRQLGKSALLRQVWREFHDPSKGKFAILEDIKPLGDPRSGQEYSRAFWERLTDAVNRAGFLDVPVTITPPRLIERIRQRIEERDWRLLLLLDEADNFLEADSKQNFPVVTALKRLMDDTGRRFKVVFAGLHNVQRFQRIPNQPLAHLGRPIEIGPLEPDAARELLERPLWALGFRFGEDNEDPSVILHVLSYTNYHPGLIQLFAKELVDRLRNVRRSGLPPFGITRADVETVYRQPEVRQAIRERFAWTLALDERYEAIALAMILDQWDVRDGFDRLYRSGEIKNLVEGLWPAGFEGMEQDQFKGYLDEMCGLGVLDYARVGTEDRYRLRSPNVVQLMGTYEELWDRLDEIARTTPPPPLSLESHHALLDKAVYSPLTYAQEGMLKNSRTGVGLVFGSEALQVGYVKEVTRRFVEVSPVSSQTWKGWEEIRIPSKSGKALMAWLEDRTKGYRGQNLRVFFRDLEGTFWQPEELEDQVRTALKFCSSRPWARIIFVLGPMVAWQWFQLPPERRENLEESVGAVVAVRPWDAVGIRQRLEQHEPELMAQDRQCRRIHEVTGGWHLLIDEFLKRCQTSNDPIPPLEEFAKELAQPENPVRRRFRERLQIPAGLPERFVDCLQKEQRKYGGEDYWIPWNSEIILHLLLEKESVSPQFVDAAIEYLLRMSVLRQRIVERGVRTKKAIEREISLDPVVYRLWSEESLT